jgi:lipoprotein-anchoring transpeptidase ErfK/SrfK
MKLFGLWFALFLMIVTLPAWAEPLDMEAVNTAAFEGKDVKSPALVVKAQILLDRKRHSPGVIDGLSGDATEIALKAFQADNSLEATGKLDEASFAKLMEGDSAPVLSRYTISAEDVKGPFIDKVPTDIAEKAKLKRMAFTGPQEALAERFHMDEDLLKQLNPDTDFGKEGTEIVVAAVEHVEEGRAAEGEAPTDRIEADRLVIDKSERTLRVFGKDGKLIALYPATIGSESNPAPDGETRIERIAKGPTWDYDPKLQLEGEKDRPDKPMTVQPGPNNPVGTVWIALDRDHYGIHGTPEPEKIGKTLSSGCVRLTNWDVEELAGLVKKGVPVFFQE